MIMGLDFYDQHFAYLMRQQTEAYLDQVQTFICREAQLVDGAKVLDQGCGIGRLAHKLASKGFAVTGIDQNRDYIAEARLSNGHQPTAPAPQFLVGDARQHPEAENYDLVVSWHTSFGHFSEDQDNLELLKTAYRNLKSDGYMILDYANFQHTKKFFKPCFKQTYPTQEGPLEVWRYSEFEGASENSEVLKQTWEFRYPDGQVFQRQGSIRAYTPEKLKAFLESTGFCFEQSYADLAGHPFDLNSPRWIGRARKMEVT